MLFSKTGKIIKRTLFHKILYLIFYKKRRKKKMSKPMGMMSGVYFVGRGELIQWINDLLALNYTKVEDTANGAAFCQVIDAIHPGTVALGRVKFDAYNPADMTANYKVLQDAFNKNQIQQYIDVVTLIKGKYMAALELFQWIHGYYLQTGPHGDYDAVARRKHFKCKEPTFKTKPGQINAVKPAGMAKREKPVAGVKPKCILNAANVPQNYGNGDNKLPVGAIPNAPSANLHRELNQKEQPKRKIPIQENDSEDEKPVKKAAPQKKYLAPKQAQQPTVDHSKELREVKKHVSELEGEVDQLNQERDFYYGKLRRIEEFCQQHEEDEMVKQILEIMYETDEEKGFVTPEAGDEEEEED